jgi:catechol 2,3-dioxygenase-like lactoylglutathione lyase family enzyme
MSQGIKTVIFPVNDLARAKSLFSRLAGTEPHTDRAYYVGFRVEDQEIGLDPNGRAKECRDPRLGSADVPSADSAVRPSWERGRPVRILYLSRTLGNAGRRHGRSCRVPRLGSADVPSASSTSRKLLGMRVGVTVDPSLGRSYWHVADIRKSLQALLDGGAQFQQDVRDVGGGRLIASVKDPDGNSIGLLQAS